MKYKVALCLIFKNEAPFLKEWLDFHLSIGVNHFYLYDNNSTDNYAEIIQNYIEKGIVTLISWPKEHSQFEAYKHCYENYRKECNWMSFLDADEFICMKYKRNISDWLDDFSKYPAITIYWLIFGTGGKLKHDYSKNVIEQYYASWDHFFNHGKTIINTQYEIANYFSGIVHHHTYMYYSFFGIKFILPAVNPFGFFCEHTRIWGGGRNKIERSSIQINHYYSKAWDVYYNKMYKSDVLFEQNPKGEFRFFRNESRCISENHTINRFLIQMKLFQKEIHW